MNDTNSQGNSTFFSGDSVYRFEQNTYTYLIFIGLVLFCILLICFYSLISRRKYCGNANLLHNNAHPMVELIRSLNDNSDEEDILFSK